MLTINEKLRQEEITNSKILAEKQKGKAIASDIDNGFYTIVIFDNITFEKKKSQTFCGQNIRCGIAYVYI